MLWPGVLLMLLVAFADLIVDGKVIYEVGRRSVLWPATPTISWLTSHLLQGFRNIYWDAQNKISARKGLPPKYTLVPQMEDPAKP